MIYELEQLKRAGVDWMVQHASDLLPPVVLDVETGMCLIGCLQLSLRHPGNTGPSAEHARRFIRTLQAQFPADSVPYMFIEMGFDSRFDQ